MILIKEFWWVCCIHLLLTFAEPQNITSSEDATLPDNATLPETTALPQPPPPAPGSIFFFAVASRQYGWYCDMLLSAASNNITMHIYGFGNKKLTKQSKVRKIGHILEALQSVPPDTVSVMVDAFDVLFADGEEKIMQGFRKLNTSVVVGCEKGCYNEMLVDCRKFFPMQPSGYFGLNSGAMIGITRNLLELYFRAKEYRSRNPKKTEHQRKATDQGFVGQAYLEAQQVNASIMLDCNETVIQNMYLANDDFCEPDLRNCVTGTHPSIFHFNGGKMKDKPVGGWRKRFWWEKNPPKELAPIWINGEYYNLSQVCRMNNGQFVRYW